MQIRTKLTLYFIGIAAGISLLSLFFVYVQFERHVLTEFIASLRSKAYMTADMLIKSEKEASTLRPIAERRQSSITPFTENIMVYNAAQQRLYTYNEEAPAIEQQVFRQIERHDEYHFERSGNPSVGIRYVNKDGISYYVFAEGKMDRAILNSLRTILWIAFFLMIGLVAIGGWIFAGQALAPVSRIMNQIDDLFPSNLKRRLEPHNHKDELARLVITFNKLLDRIQEAFTLQKGFLSNISHEIKNPLTTIIAQLEVALQKDREKEAYRDTIYSVLEDVRKLNETSEKLMQLARLNAQKDQLDWKQLRLDELIWQTREEVLRNHPEAQIRIDMNNLPEQEEELLITGNESLMRTALSNLLDNACKYSKDNSAFLRLDCSSPKTLTLEVIDNGPGIDDEEKTSIFQPFYRSDRTAHIKGSGIGLSLVSTILKWHRINCEIESSPGHGSLFRLLIPREAQPQPNERDTAFSPVTIRN